MGDARNAGKFSPFSVDAILAREGPRSVGRVARERVAATGDGDRGSSNSSSVDDAWLRQLFADVTRRLLAARSSADTGPSSSTYSGKEPEDDPEQFTDSNNISTLIKLNSLQSFPSSVGSWLERRHPPMHDVRIPRADGRTSTSPESRSRGRVRESSVELPAVGMDHRGRHTRRRAELNVVDGLHRTLSPARNDVDVVGCYLDEESTPEADGGSGPAWSTTFRYGLKGDFRGSSPFGHLYSHGDNHAGVQNDFSATRVDSTLLWHLAHPSTSKQRSLSECIMYFAIKTGLCRLSQKGAQYFI